MKKISGTILLTVLATLGLSFGTIAPASAVSHASAASQFSAAGIGWTSSGGCSDPANSTCTSFEGTARRPSTARSP